MTDSSRRDPGKGHLLAGCKERGGGLQATTPLTQARDFSPRPALLPRLLSERQRSYGMRRPLVSGHLFGKQRTRAGCGLGEPLRACPASFAHHTLTRDAFHTVAGEAGSSERRRELSVCLLLSPGQSP